VRRCFEKTKNIDDGDGHTLNDILWNYLQGTIMKGTMGSVR